MPTQRTLIDNLEYALTLDAERRVIRHASIAIEESRISRVAKSEVVSKEYSKGYFDRTVDGRRCIATPGFIDTHVHTHEHLSRGLFPDNIDTASWTYEWAYPFYGNTTEEDEYASALLCCADMLRTGTTCFLESGARFPRSVARAVEETGIRGIIGRRVMDNPPSKLPEKWPAKLRDELYFPSADAALSETRRSIEDCRALNNERIRAWVTINGKDTCTDELYVRAHELSRELTVGMHFHIASSLKEAKASEKKRGVWPITHVEQLGVLRENVVMAHATMVGDSEVSLIRDRQAKVSFCPGSALKLAKGAGPYGKYPELLSAGATVSLGCDGAAAAGSFDMTRQVYLASGMFKDSRLDERMIPAELALEMGTLMGARALQWEDEIGSIEEGKCADIAIFNAAQLEWLPLNDPVQNLVYSASGLSVDCVLVNGEVVVEKGGRVRALGEDGEVLRAVEASAKRSIERSGLHPSRSWKYE